MAGSVSWSREEEKAFENAIAMHWIEKESKERWVKIASMVPSKSVEELKRHYEILVEDVRAIDAGEVPLPYYAGEKATSSAKDVVHGFSDKKSDSGYGTHGHDSNGQGGKGSSKSDQERKKGIPWTEEEHRLFLLGLDKFGKGDWRSISRNLVISRTPTQVASHAQKYFIRLNSMNRDKRRSSIHDITNVNNGDTFRASQQANTNSSGAAAAAMGELVKHRAQPNFPGLGLYGTPVGRHMGSAVGTPVMVPPVRNPPPPYNVPAAYPVAPPPMHQ